MRVYLFHEISLSESVTSVYDSPEIVIHSKIYEYTNNIGELIVKIIKTYPFRSSKSLHGLSTHIMETIKTFELQRNLDTPELEGFYESMHAQDFEDGINNPWKYKTVIDLDNIISNAVKLGIVPAKKLLKYLLESEEGWSYELTDEEVC